MHKGIAERAQTHAEDIPAADGMFAGLDRAVQAARRESVYEEACAWMSRGEADAYLKAQALFLGIGDHRDAAEKAALAAELAKKRVERDFALAKRRRVFLFCGAAVLILATLTVFIAFPVLNRVLADGDMAREDYALAVRRYKNAWYFGEDKLNAAYLALGQQFDTDGDFASAAAVYWRGGDYDSARAAFKARGDELDEAGKHAAAAVAYWRAGDMDYAQAASDAVLSAGGLITLGLQADGSVCSGGDFSGASDGFNCWKDIVAVSSGGDYALGLRSDGNVVVYGDIISYNELKADEYVMLNLGETEIMGSMTNSENFVIDPSAWRDIVAISAGVYHAVALTAKGTVVATGSDQYGQGDVEGWKDIVAVSCGGMLSAGLRQDGTVAVAGPEKIAAQAAQWSGITCISAGYDFLSAVTQDGRVLVAGEVDFDVSDWTDVVAVSAGYSHLLALRRDGTVYACGSNGYGQCDTDMLRDIVALSAGNGYSVLLHADGSVTALGHNGFGKTDVDGWNLFY